MKRLHRIVATLALILTGTLTASALSGRWRGELKMGPAAIPLIFDFAQAEEGGMLCTLYSPQQTSAGIPMTVDYLSADSIALTSAALGATFRGHVTPTRIAGRFAQRGYSVPLVLEQEEPLSARRPQTPQAPYPYRSVDTLFTAADGTLLAGTLTLPDKPAKEKMTLAVMVTGSGPQNRDEEIFEHRPFAVIADYLARNGIATFRYDDRGTAESKGDFHTSTTYTFKEDAAAALKFARSIDNAGEVGVIGHSEGGTIALMLAEENLTDFIVSLAGMAISGKETILDQNRHLMEQLGLDRQTADESMQVIEAVFEEIAAQAREHRREPIDLQTIAKRSGATVPPMIMQSLKTNLDKRTDFFDTFLAIDPSRDLEKIECPVLALNGTLDTQVDASKNLSVIRQGIRHAEIYEPEGLNHLFQHATTGEMSEYADIRETVSPDVLALIADFLARR